MQILSARYTDDWLVLDVDGKLAWIDTKFSVLHAGAAVLLDPDDEPTHWEDATSAEIVVDQESEHARHVMLRGGTTDPVVVCLARRYFDAKNSDRFTVGVVRVPTQTEAERELAQPWRPELAAA